MLILNLHQASNYKVENSIKTICGGHHRNSLFKPLKKIGIGGLSFKDLDDNSSFNGNFRVNLEVFKYGLGIYFRNYVDNYLVLLKMDEIKMIEFNKKADILQPSKNSLFTIVSNLGLPYHLSKILLLDKEIIEENEALLSILTTDKRFDFTFRKNKHPESIKQFFSHDLFYKYVKFDYENMQLFKVDKVDKVDG